MKTEKEWSQEVLKITMKIRKEFPELSKFIKEMPVMVAEKDTDGTNTVALEDYYNSLADLITDYSKTHAKMKNKKDKK